MKLIAHRGNLIGPLPEKENSIDYIEEAISKGYDVEVDLRVKDNDYYLGHDDFQHLTSLEWLLQYKNILWIHCKNHDALEKMIESNTEFNFFWHQEDDYTITSKGYVWCYPGKIPTKKSIIVMPEWEEDIKNLSEIKKLYGYGICSDYVSMIK